MAASRASQFVDGEYVPYILGALEFAAARFPDGDPAATPLTVRGDAP